MSFFANIRKLDAYTKPVEDFRERTVTGAVITILCSILCLILFLSEVRYYLTTEIISELQVDNSRGKKMVINLDISMSQMPCNYFSIDAMETDSEPILSLSLSISVLMMKLSFGCPINFNFIVLLTFENVRFCGCGQNLLTQMFRVSGQMQSISCTRYG